MSVYVLAMALLPVGVGVGLHKGNGQREICTVCINYLMCGVNLVGAGGSRRLLVPLCSGEI